MDERVRRMSRALAVMAAAIAAPGCGPDIQSICEQTEECRGGNAEDVEACVIATEFEQDFASDVGCGSEYDAYFDCFEAEAQCTDQGSIPCQSSVECGGAVCDNGMCRNKSFELEGDACETERNAYQQCFDLD
jgi:hypothetical protein